MSTRSQSPIGWIGPKTEPVMPFADEISTALTDAIAAASDAERLTVLTLFQTPGALAATEKFIAAVAGERR